MDDKQEEQLKEIVRSALTIGDYCGESVEDFIVWDELQAFISSLLHSQSEQMVREIEGKAFERISDYTLKREKVVRLSDVLSSLKKGAK